MPFLEVPFMPQWGVGANRYRTDCGPASVLMVGQYFGKMMDLTVDDVSAQTALIFRDNGLMPAALVTLGLLHNLQLYVKQPASLDDIRAEIDKGCPVIPLIHYRFISGRLDQADANPLNDGHFLVVTGYTEGPNESNFVANDPDVWQPYLSRGHNEYLPVKELDKAMEGFGYACVFSRPKEQQNMTLKEQINALRNQEDALIAQLQEPIVTPPTSRPSTVNGPAGTVNVRATPGTGAILTALANGTPLNVVDSPTFNWSQIVDGTYKNDFIYTPYLSFS